MKDKKSAIKFIMDCLDMSASYGFKNRETTLSINNCELIYRDTTYKQYNPGQYTLDARHTYICDLSNLDPDKIFISGIGISIYASYDNSVIKKYTEWENIPESLNMTTSISMKYFKHSERVAKAFSYLIKSCDGQEGW